ncbi:4053_t:CDS:2, partial [Funneliformis caledonium]
NKKLDVNKTFKSQRESVNNHIIPVIQKAIDRKVFPVVDGIISLEISETDDENPNKRKIIIQDLKWRSSTITTLTRHVEQENGCIVMTNSYLMKKKHPNNNIREKDVDDNIYINKAEDEEEDKEDEKRNEEEDKEEDDNVDDEEKIFQRSRNLVSGVYNSYEDY